MAQVLIAMGLTYWSMIAFGATCAHVLADLPQVRDGAEAAHDAADAEGVGDGLAQAELLRHLEVGDGAGVVAADLEADDDEVGAVERGALVAEGFHRGGDAEGLGELADDDLGFIEALGVDVHQPDLGVGERRALQDVAGDVLGEDGGAGADEGDLGHGMSQDAMSKAARTSRRV